MKIAIRADASHTIGSGHFMRCLTLASELQDIGAEIKWLAYELDNIHMRMLDSKQIELIQLPSASSIGCASILQDKGIFFDWLIIDHYQWALEDEIRMLACVFKIMVIDDLANRSHYCHLLLDQNESFDMHTRYDRLLNAEASRLLGSKYALLREQFAYARLERKLAYDGMFNILVSYGGTDPTNETWKALDAIEGLPASSKVNIMVILGNGNKMQEEIANRCETHDNWNLYIQTNNMADFMQSADVALCAGGTTTWERYCLGLPGIVTIVADNQIEIVQFGEKSGIDYNMGYSNNVTAADIQRQLLVLLHDKQRLNRSAHIAMGLVDGKGAKRVVEYMRFIDNKRGAEA